MYLYGASGHAKVIIDILRANHEPIEALFDDNEEIRHSRISPWQYNHVIQRLWTL